MVVVEIPTSRPVEDLEVAQDLQALRQSGSASEVSRSQVVGALEGLEVLSARKLKNL